MGNTESKILIYSPLVSDRFRYITGILCNRVLGLDYEFTDNKDYFREYRHAKFSYASANPFPDAPFISAGPLLFETGINEPEIDIFSINGFKAFFRASDDSFFPFDIFSAAFYLLSRYEEYLPFKKDKYGRFAAENSLAFREGFLEEPIVNQWTLKLGEELCKLFPALHLKKTKFSFISTIDVDNAWAHLNKGFLRTFFSFARLILHFDLKGLNNKFKVIFNKKPDPYDNYDFINETHQKYGIQPIYFFLFSSYSSYDKNPSIKNTKFRDLIRKISENYIIGMHPSFKSNTSFTILCNEKINLESIYNKEITISRQHYLYLKMPLTYENLINLGIRRDFSMGYSSHPGFRASFCLPYPFFNLETNQERPLELVPFAFMDACFRDYYKIGPEKALIRIKKIISSIKKVGGLFVSLWHNETFTNEECKIGWHRVLDEMLNEINHEN